MENVQENEQVVLRPKEECEQQLSVELAVGAVDSIDSLIDKGHEVACEYACQLLFDNLRKRVAMQPNLPSRIVQHLLKDRCDDVRYEVMEHNWEILTPEQREKFLNEAKVWYDAGHKGNYGYHKEYPTSAAGRIIKKLLKEALLAKDESASLRYMKMYKIKEGLPIVKADIVRILKDMPKVFRVYWEGINSYYRAQNLILAHPDEDIRMIEVKRILEKETRVCDLGEWARCIGRATTGETLKGNILYWWADDPSEAIRKLIVSNTTSVKALEMFISDQSDIVASIAYPRFKKFQKRAAYSLAYQQRKKEKADKEYRKRYKF